MSIDGFEYRLLEVEETTYRPGVAGNGPPVLLLHGFPQTHNCWHLVAPPLAEGNTVVVCDLKGYGESRSAARSWGHRIAANPPGGRDAAGHRACQMRSGAT